MQIKHRDLRVKAGKAKQTCFEVAEQSELMKLLLALMPDKGRNTIKSLLAHRQVMVDNKVITQYDHLLEIGQHVVVNWVKVQEESQPEGLKILFEDPYLVIIEKEAGLLSIATAKERELTAYSILSEHVKKRDPKNRIFVLHRLDRETSGVMMFAKSQEVQQVLQNAWKEAVLERNYVVVVEGLVTKEQGTITSWLKESKTLVMYSSHSPNDGQMAVTHYQVLQKNKNYSLLEVKLETGRKNQIRVHMQDLGHSIIGDKKYGAMKSPIRRLGLHARVLAFRHPVTGEEVRFETQIPQEFLRLFSV
ncbi:MAG: RluA family pseudouridine synthase [Desulfitobacteriaceae bacterium]